MSETSSTSGPSAAGTVTPQVVERPAQPYVGVRDHVTMTTFHLIADRFGEIFDWLGAHGVEPAGPPFFRYRTIDMERSLEVEAGVPVAAPVAPTEPVFADTLPAGRYADVTFVGHPDGLLAETTRLLQWAADAGLDFDRRDSPAGDAWACRLEVFHSDPAEVPDMNQWRTQLLFELAR